MESRLLTAAMIEALKQYPLYSQDDKRGDAVCVAVLGIGNIRWYIIEGEQQGDDFTFFRELTSNRAVRGICNQKNCVPFGV